MKEIPEEKVWHFLLELKNSIRHHMFIFESLIIVFRDNDFVIFINEHYTPSVNDIIFLVNESMVRDNPLFAPVFLMDKQFKLTLKNDQFLAERNLCFLENYLPLCFFSLRAQKIGRSITLLHLAQSLDGKIAAANGQSKWIGNTENQVHAHRLRALSDGVLIGANTLITDKPRLTVRLVEGPDPVKIVLGSNHCEFGCLLENRGKVLFITSEKSVNTGNVEEIVIPKTKNHIRSETILTELYKLGIYSLFIEGGAYTASLFLSDKTIDTLQLFIAPKIFGSGIDCFSLQEISTIAESISFSSQSFTAMGNGMLFSGEVNY